MVWFIFDDLRLRASLPFKEQMALLHHARKVLSEATFAVFSLRGWLPKNTEP